MKKVFVIFTIIGLFVYANSLYNGFVWDDEEQVLANSLAHSITNLPQFFAGSTFNTGGSGNLSGLYYKPMMTVCFALMYSLFGPNAFVFHLFQVSIHIVNAFILYLIFKKLFNAPDINTKDFRKNSLTGLVPLALSLIFLVHPINSEAVVYIASLQDVLFFFFGALSLLLLIYKPLNSRTFLSVFFLLFLSLLSKETGAVFILICVVYIYLYKKNFLGQFLGWITSAILIYAFLRFLIAGVYFNKHGLSPITRISLLERLPSMPKIFFEYIKNFVFPINLAISQHWVVSKITLLDFWVPLTATLAFLASLFLLVSKYFQRKTTDFKLFLFFSLWFLLGMGLHLQIIPLDMTYADRWFYLPIVGLLGILGLFISRIKITSPTVKNLLLVTLLLITLLLIVRTIIRNSNWKDSLTLYEHDIKIATGNFDLENNYGVALFRAGRLSEAKTHFIRSTEIAPFWWTNWNNLGAIVEREGDATKAAQLYQKSIDNGDYYLAHENRAQIYFKLNNPEMAKKAAEDSLKKLPNNSKIWLTLSLAEYQLGNRDKALLAARNSFLITPTEQSYYIVTRLEQGLDLEFEPKP